MISHYKKNIFRVLLTLSILGSITACQHNGGASAQVSSMEDSNITYSNNTQDYGQYYLYLQQLESKELFGEIERQKSALETGDENARIGIILLYSLPKSPIYNVYSAKTVLNKQIKNIDKGTSNIRNFAFLTLLKDQLNQQIKLINVSELDGQLKVTDSFEDANLIANNRIVELEAEVIELLKKIKQLRDIDKAISSQGYH